MDALVSNVYHLIGKEQETESELLETTHTHTVV